MVTNGDISVYDTYFTLFLSLTSLSCIVLFAALLVPAHQPRLAIPHDSMYPAWHTGYSDTDCISNESISLLKIAERYSMDELTFNRLLFARYLIASGKLSEDCQ